MNAKDDEFSQRLQAMFRVEAEEHIRAISAGLDDLGKTADPVSRASVIEAVFREAHSLKGAARSVNLPDIESVCQSLEGCFQALKRLEIVFSPGLADLARQATDILAQLVVSLDGKRTPPDRALVKGLIRHLGSISRESVASVKTNGTGHAAEAPGGNEASPHPKSPDPAVHAPAEQKPILAGTVRISTDRLDPLLLQAEEMILAGMSAAQRVVELKGIGCALTSWQDESVHWKERQRGAVAAPWSELLQTNETCLHAIQGRVAAVIQALEQDQRVLKRMVDIHLEAMKSILMLPISSLVEGFPKFAHDLASDQGKDVELVVRGADIEVDKRILDEMKDPLIHLVRNCVDHGIEKSAERARKNKPARATIVLAFALKDNRQVEITVSDDGAGIDEGQVRTAAIKAGVMSREATEALGPQEVVTLVFQSGISTSPIITEISGRGLGLAIAREKVEKLGGTVSVDTQTDRGTTFHLLVPLTLATFRGILVRVGEHVFMLPGVNVTGAVRIGREEIKTVENKATVRIDGSILTLVSLADLLELSVRSETARTAADPDAGKAPERTSVLILASAERRIAVQVDEILGEQEVLVKGFGRQLSRVRNVAGATILGSGRVVPVLNVGDLMKSATRSVSAVRNPATAEETLAEAGRILVAEDSITARTLLKNILVIAGYQVATAVDGMDAITQLRSEEFDLVVSDVDMPRMSGFELTAAIRADKKFSELPVVLVTALESREDKERGIEVGANAYIVKSSFEQSNLLEVVRRLL